MASKVIEPEKREPIGQAIVDDYGVFAFGDKYHVEFKIYAVNVCDDGTKLWGSYSDSYSDDWRTARDDIEGTIKWDGCSNWDFAPHNTMLHACGFDDWIKVTRVVAWCWLFAARHINNFESHGDMGVTWQVCTKTGLKSEELAGVLEEY